MKQTARRGTVVVATALALSAVARVSPAAAQPGAAAGTPRALSLEDALRMAEGVSPDVAVARAGVTRAQGQQVQARADFFPQIYGSASYVRTLQSQFSGLGTTTTTTPTTTPPPAQPCGAFIPHPELPIGNRVDSLEHALKCGGGGFGSIGSLFSNLPFGQRNTYNLGLSATQTVFDGGRVLAQNRLASAGRRVADIGLTASRAQLLLDVAQAYYDAQLGDRLVTIAEATLQQAETTLTQTRLARTVGNTAEFDLLRAQVTRDNQRPVLIQQRANRDIAYTRLKQILDVPLGQPLALTTELGDTVTVRPAQLAALVGVSGAAGVDTLPDDRAPVRQAAEAVQVSEAQRTIARASRLPALSVSSAYGRVAYPSGAVPNWADFRSNWTVTASLSVPIFTGFRLRGDATVAEANLSESRARYEQTRQLAQLDTRTSLSRLQAAEAQFAASVGTTEQASRAYQIADVRYREGISTQTELSDSRILLQQAQANRAQAARDLQIARLRLVLLRDLPIGSGTGASQQAGQGGQQGGQGNAAAGVSQGAPQGRPQQGPSAGAVSGVSAAIPTGVIP